MASAAEIFCPACARATLTAGNCLAAGTASVGKEKGIPRLV